jgi:hypothetical protein
MNRPKGILGGLFLAFLVPLVIFWALVMTLLGRDRLVKDLEYTLWGFDD